METTRLSAAMLDSRWAWPLSEAVHFAGLVLLIGTVGLFDLRVLGLGRGIPPAAIHRLVKLGVLGFAFSAARSEEHTSELQSRENLVCRLLLEKKNKRHR